MWNFIPINIFKEVGGLPFLLKCNFNIAKLPLKLSSFYQQALLAWKLCHIHNFSPHRTIIWSNEYILTWNKSLFLKKWIDNNIIFIENIFENEGEIMNYGRLMDKYNFLVTPKEYNYVIKSIPNGIRELMKSYNKIPKENTCNKILLNGIEIRDKKCS